MIDWYYHAPGEGRVGPLSAETMRKRYQDRLLQRDTLVWHAGLREWQPLEQLASELGIERLHPQAGTSTIPPPMPVSAPAVPTSPIRAAPRGKYARAPLRQKKTLSGGAIALIIAALIAIPGVMIMGAQLLPAYQDYARNATRLGSVEGLSNGLKRVVAEHALRTGRCPANDDARLTRVRREIRQRAAMNLRFADIDGGCAFEIAIDADGQPLDGRTLRYEGRPDAGGFAWDCSGGDMPDAYRPYECRSDG
jgi:type IV pilus assembly protein PilA